MAVVIKIIILFFSFVIGLNNIENWNAICAIVSFLLFGYIFYSLNKQYKHFINNEYDYYCPYKHTYKDYEADDYWNFNWNRSKNYIYYDSYSVNKSTIKSIETKFKKKKHNFIEFCDKPKFLIKNNNDMEIDNLRTEKPKISFDKVLTNIETNEKRNNKLDGSSVIMIVNDDKIDDIKKSVYDVIIKTLNKYTLSPNERYALLQSFYYIDICPMSIVIYVDKFILEKAHLSEDDLHKDELVDKIRDVLYCPNMDINFVNLECVNLLNYYLK